MNPWEDESPNPLQGPVSSDEGSALTALALMLRYGTADPKRVLPIVKREFGLAGYDIPAEKVDMPLRKVDKGRERLGQFMPTGWIAVNKNQDDIGTLATTVHELAHAADTMRYNPDPFSNERGPHHEAFENFEPEFAQSILAQREIEDGGKVSKETLARYPWLAQVKPLSSNKLATPWRGKPAMPKDIWNEMRRRIEGK